MGGKAVWCILIVGLLLLAVSSTAERDTEKEKEEEIRWCKKDCDWKAGADAGKAKECKQQCERRRRRHDNHHVPDRCERMCERYEDWGTKVWCTQQCRATEHQKLEGGNSEIEEIKAKCKKECEDFQRPRRWKMCFEDCMEFEIFGGHGFMPEERIVNSDDKRRHGDHCQTRCKRFRPGSYDRQQCIDKCQSQKPEDEEEVMNLNHHGHGGGGHGGHAGSSSCEEDCQKRYRHGYEKQQCVRDCKSGGGGGAGGRGREGDERRHDWETVAEAVLLKEV